MSEDLFNENSDMSEWMLHLDKIRNNKKSSAITRMLAATLQLNPYMTIGQFLKNLNDDDLHSLLEKTEDIGPENEGTEDVLLITMMLAQAEGTSAETMETLLENVNAMCIFIAGTSLARKGLVKAYYDNMSFGADMREALVFERI